ncbi:MAG: ABC transporter substrate-binding protein [Candidatus Odyssella sp.]|nr:ABC transporter substrate-binding protein [Candidatus Odyssella sp.]
MRRRDVVAMLGGSAAMFPRAPRILIPTFGSAWLAGPSAARAQPAGRVFRIGCLYFAAFDNPVPRQLFGAFRQGLADLGYVEGKSVVFDHRSAEGRVDRFPDLAAELVRLRVDLIVAFSMGATRAARRATTAIPIVSFALGDAVGAGFALSLSRPGGNVTGFSVLAPELAPKALSLLHEAVPKASRIAALWSPGSLSAGMADDMLSRTGAAARSIGVELALILVRAAKELDEGFSEIARQRAQAVLVLPSPLSNTERTRISQLANRHRLPSISWTREFAEAGGLMAYGSDLADAHRRGAGYAIRILKGERPAEMPIEQPSKFELAVNLKTAKALNIAIPDAILARADIVLE